MNVLGIDIGTTSICAIVLSADTGVVLERVTRGNAARLDANHSWEALQDAHRIEQETLQLVDQLVQTHGPIGAIGLTGQMHGIVYLDGDGDAVSPLITWQDGRGDQLMPDQSITYASWLSRLSGYPLATGYGSVSHFYNLYNHQVPDAAVRFCTIHDYIGMRLARRNEPLVHSSDAASIGFFDASASTFDETALGTCGLEPCIFPPVTENLEVLGKTRHGIPVIVAVGDNQASFIGSVREMARSVLVNVGTSGQISLLAAGSDPSTTLEQRPLTGSNNLLVGSILSGGSSYALLEQFFRSVLTMAGVDLEDRRLYGPMNNLAQAFSEIADSEKLAVDNRFRGTRSQPDLRGTIRGIGPHNFTAQHLVIGVIEGIVEELFDFYHRLDPQPAVDRLIGSGNALRNNIVMQQIFAKRFGLPLQIPAHQEEAAFGAALCGLTGIGFVDSLEQAQQLIRYE